MMWGLFLQHAHLSESCLAGWLTKIRTKKGNKMILFDASSIDSRWVHGHTDDGYTFDALVFAEPSEHGISTLQYPDGGLVSKLYIKDGSGKSVYEFDRGTEHIIAPYDEIVDVACEITLELEKLFSNPIKWDE